MRVLHTGHGPALALLAQTLADHDRVRAALHTLDYKQLITEEVGDAKGRIHRRLREHPLIPRSERVALLVNRLLGEFGLTPATQTRVHAEADTPVNRARRYLG